MKDSNYAKYIFFIQSLIDLLLIILLFFLFLNVQYSEKEEQLPTFLGLLEAHYKALILFLFSWFFIAGNTHIYNFTRYNDFIHIIRKLILQILFFAVIVFAVSGFKSAALFSYRLSLYFLLAIFLNIFVFRLIFFYLAKFNRHLGGNFRRILFIDENKNTHSFIQILKKQKDLGFINCGMFLADVSTDNEKKIYSFDCRRLKNFLQEQKIQIIFLSLNGKLALGYEDKIMDIASTNHITVNFIPDTVYDNFSSMELAYYDTFPILAFKNFPLDNIFNQFIKRTFDIIFSLFVIIFILSWLVPLVALAIVLDSGNPVFYNQQRIGLNGKSFGCHKFRTMRPSKDNDIKATVKGDTRITRLGKLLRETSIDEFPQFFNVLKGSMSVVGPRPHMELQDSYYNDLIHRYNMRHQVKPGITGLAQVKGFRGEISVDTDMIKRVTADIYYVKNWSFLLDISIIIGTVFKVIMGDKQAV
ncbi:MAG: exopolysaccharide biosynthesis polyprenyl glycosylphosphotransferase [Flavobacteriaceae bacterium]|jgi:Undecaprenyl-phosphate glucose phosphotransferase|nr:exopolysaccharide biosynthesis polyprenyl glycosylphosphotransferase [Flavobacteriaceae bacterium]